ncbi:MAG: amidase family protein, partial [Thermoplasmata archaeon]
PRRPFQPRILAIPRDSPFGDLPGEVDVAFRAALDGMDRELGFVVDDLSLGSLFRTDPNQDWFTWTASELVTWVGRDVINEGLDLFHPTTRTFLEAGMLVSIDEYLAARKRCLRYEQALDDLLEDGSFIATPTVASSGWTPEGTMPGEPGDGLPPDVYNTGLASLTGHPAVSIPAGRLPNGLPFGLQVIGPKFGEEELLRLAELLEAARSWPLVAPGYETFDV